jgi:predicted HicB family RNase H-like nuclease
VNKKNMPSSSSYANKVFGVRIDNELVKKIKILAVKKEMQVNKLLEEGIIDLLKKYKEL